MTDKRDEALKLAQEAMNLARAAHGQILLSDPPQEAWKAWGVSAALTKAMTAVSEALAEQPAQQQKPVAWMDAEGDVYKTEPPEGWCPPHTPLYTSPQPAQEQEPVAWGVDWGKAGDRPCVSIIKRLPGGGIEVLATEYGPPASKPWVGLTDVERIELMERTHPKNRWPLLALCEDKLREKNA